MQYIRIYARSHAVRFNMWCCVAAIGSLLMLHISESRHKFAVLVEPHVQTSKSNTLDNFNNTRQACNTPMNPIP